MSKSFDVKADQGKLLLDVDPNKDGEKVVSLGLYMSEAVEEIFKRGNKIEGAKLVDFELDMTKLKLKIDTDKDGESILDLEIDLAEAVDEVKDLLSKK